MARRVRAGGSVGLGCISMLLKWIILGFHHIPSIIYNGQTETPLHKPADHNLIPTAANIRQAPSAIPPDLQRT